MSDFFSIYNSIGRRGSYLTEAVHPTVQVESHIVSIEPGAEGGDHIRSKLPDGTEVSSLPAQHDGWWGIHHGVKPPKGEWIDAGHHYAGSFEKIGRKPPETRLAVNAHQRVVQDILSKGIGSAERSPGNASRGNLGEAVLSVDSNRDVTSRGNSHNDKTLTDPNTRDKILHARVQEIEAFAKDRGIDPVVVLGAAEAALRTGRVPNLSMYGLGGDNMVAVKHFIAGEILNLAGMEAIGWDGEKIEEAESPASHRAIATRLVGVVDRHLLGKRHPFTGEPLKEGTLKSLRDDEKHAYGAFKREINKRIMTLLKGGEHNTSEPHWHQLHAILSANQNEVLDKNAPEEIHNFINTPPKPKSDQGKPQERWGVPKERGRGEQDPDRGPLGMKRAGGKVGGPKTQTSDIEIKGQLQQEYGSPSDRNASGGMGTITGAPSAAANHPTEPGKEMIPGNISSSTIKRIKKGQAEAHKNEKTGAMGTKKGSVTKLVGLTDKQLKTLAQELGAKNTGESMDANDRRLLNIEPSDPRNERWPKMSDELQKLLSLDARPQTHGVGNIAAKRVEQKQIDEPLPVDPQNESWPKMGPELKRLLNVESKGLYFREQGPSTAAVAESLTPCANCGRYGDAVNGGLCYQCAHHSRGPKKQGGEANEQSSHGGTALPGNVAPVAPVAKPPRKMAKPAKQMSDVDGANMVEAGIGGKLHKAGRPRKFRPAGEGAMTGKDENVAAKIYGMLPFVHRHSGSRRLIDQMLSGETPMPATTDEKAAMPHIKQAALVHLRERGHVADDFPDNANPVAESTFSGSIGGFMKLGNQVVGRPSQIATWDASVDLNGFQPARVGMLTTNPVVPVNEARRYRDADAAAEFIANKKLLTKAGIDPNVALHKGDDGSIHVQIRGAKGKDGTHPSEDPGNGDVKFRELTRSERGRFAAQPAGVKARTRTAMTGIPGAQTVAPETKRHAAMQTLRGALAQIRGAAR